MEDNFTYHAQHMHVHSCYEPGASMEGHIFNAKNLGMRYIWFTDHDIRMGIKRNEFDRFDFSDGLTYECDGKSVGFLSKENQCGSICICNESSHNDGNCMKMSTVGEGEEWKGCEATLVSCAKSHTASLLSDIALFFKYKTEISDAKNSRLVFDVKLSERPPEHKTAHILYVAGSTEGLDALHTLVIPIEEAHGWSWTEFKLSSDSVTAEADIRGIGGLDNCFDSVTVRLEARDGARAVAYIDEFYKTRGHTAQETYELQKKVACEIGARYGVKPFVATEISYAGMHKNCYSTDLQILPYEARGYEISHSEACNAMLEQGKVFSINHPFVKFKRKDLSTFNLDEEVMKIADTYTENACFGASLLEVGFPDGRYLPLEYHLRLWDVLSLRGFFLTGYGASDSHSNKSGWYGGNNFVLWLGIAECEDEKNEAAFIDAMRAGRGYTGDPIFIDGGVGFCGEDGQIIGSVTSLDSEESKKVVFSYNKMRHGWRLRWIINGDVNREIFAEDGEFSDCCYVKADRAVNFVRAELYNDTGRCILITNPIYFVRRDIKEINIPKERRFDK